MNTTLVPTVSTGGYMFNLLTVANKKRLIVGTNADMDLHSIHDETADRPWYLKLMKEADKRGLLDPAEKTLWTPMFSKELAKVTGPLPAILEESYYRVLEMHTVLSVDLPTTGDEDEIIYAKIYLVEFGQNKPRQWPLVTGEVISQKELPYIDDPTLI